MRLLIILLSLLLAGQATAQNELTSRRLKSFNIEPGKAAVNGYDLVSYFTQNKAVKGKQEFTYLYQGIEYRFVSAEHLAAFKQQPGKYEPQYGGWCAFAMGSDGTKVEIDPETFRIHDGKLYLFYNRFFNNTLKTWLKDEGGLKRKADANWLKFSAP